MKKYIFLAIISVLLCSCGGNKTYRPSKYPVAGHKDSYSFTIPYQDKNGAVVVRIRLNDGPEFNGVWDSGCAAPLKISRLEYISVAKEGTLTSDHQLGSVSYGAANGDVNDYEVYMLEKVTFVDSKGHEHSLPNVPVVIDENMDTDVLIGLPVMQELGGSFEISAYDQTIRVKE